MSGRSLESQGRPRLGLNPSRRHSNSTIGRAISGRRVVFGAVVALLISWGSLFVLFSIWRSGVEERIAFGKANVVPVMEDLNDISPPGVSSADWNQAVEETKAMLEEIVGTGRIDRNGLEVLRADLTGRINRARTHPEESLTTLAGIWDDMARLKRFRTGTARPEILAQ